MSTTRKLTPPPQPGIPVGIDLGMTTTCVAMIDQGGVPQVAVGPIGERTFPSVVAYRSGTGGMIRIVTGVEAKRQAVRNTGATVFGGKRYLGLRKEEVSTRQTDGWQAAPAAGPGGDAWIDVQQGVVAPEEIVGHILAAARSLVAPRPGWNPNQSGPVWGSLPAMPALEAVLTVPARFDHGQRQALRAAAERVQIVPRRLIQVTTAAALGAGAHNRHGRIAVCHVGGGSFEAALFHVQDGVLETMSVGGEPYFGGDDFDRRIAERLGAEIREAHRVDPAAEPGMRRRLREEVEKLKHSLTASAKATVQIPNLGWMRVVSRLELESWVADLLDRFESSCRQLLAAAHGEIDELILSGGMIRMPVVQRRLMQLFRREPLAVAAPEELPALGAAVEGAILAGRIEGVIPIEATASAIGLRGADGRFSPVIPRGATIPAREHRIVPTTRDGQREVSVEIYTGDDARVWRHVATLDLGGLPDAPAGEAVVMVELTLNVDGLLEVSARELTSGATAQLMVSAGRDVVVRALR
jgi:molecular chaperone DnaK